MGGWFLDNLIEWIIRMIARNIQRIRSRSWPIVPGIVTSASCPRAAMGCHLADIFYDYAASGVEFSGLHEEPFVFHAKGEEFVGAFSKGTKIRIRVSPVDADKSVALIE